MHVVSSDAGISNARPNRCRMLQQNAAAGTAVDDAWHVWLEMHSRTAQLDRVEIGACVLTCSTAQTLGALQELNRHAQYSPVHSARGVLWSLAGETAPQRHQPSQWRLRFRSNRNAPRRNTGMHHRPRCGNLRTVGSKRTGLSPRSSCNQLQRSSVCSEQTQAGRNHPFLPHHTNHMLRFAPPIGPRPQPVWAYREERTTNTCPSRNAEAEVAAQPCWVDRATTSSKGNSASPGGSTWSSNARTAMSGVQVSCTEPHRCSSTSSRH